MASKNFDDVRSSNQYSKEVRQELAEASSIGEKRIIRQKEDEKEYERIKQYEKDLENFLDVEYCEADYETEMIAVPYTEKNKIDFESLFKERILQIKAKYEQQVGLRKKTELIKILVIVLLGAIFSGITFTHFMEVAVIIGIVTLALAGIVFKAHVSFIDKMQLWQDDVIRKTRLDIDTKKTEYLKKIEKEKAEHDLREKMRIEEVKSLIHGNENAIVARLMRAFKKIKTPFGFFVEIGIYAGVPAVFIDMPQTGKFIFPDNVVLSSQRRLVRERKTAVEVNKQYLHGCISVLTWSLVTIMENILFYDKVYASVFCIDSIGKRCLISGVATRDEVKELCNSSNKIAFIQELSFRVKRDINFYLETVEQMSPEEWESAIEREIRYFNVSVAKEVS